MKTPVNRFSLGLLAVILFVVSFKPIAGFAQTADDAAALKGKVDGLEERTSTLESTVAGMAKLKITGYVQPQWQWQNGDTLATATSSRNAFTIRRGRVKFTHTSDNISAVIYPDITENGVVIKEVYATWNAVKSGGSNLFGISMGAMNRPFGYEIAYSSSAREVTERSLFENRFFNGERDLGLQFSITPTIGSIKPLIEVGLFNGTDNFGTGPSGVLPGANNKAGFTSAPIGQGSYAASGADSLFQVGVNSAVAKEGALQLFTQGGLPGGTSNSGGATSGGVTGFDLKGNPIGGVGSGHIALGTSAVIGQPAKELIGHIRLPFLVSDEFSFDIGGSISLGGITEPSNMVGKYTGTNGALVLSDIGTKAGHSFNVQNNTFLESNRTIMGVDAQFYLSVLPFGGTIIKGELYTGHVPFYGSAFLFSKADSLAFGAPVASTIIKNVFGFYAMLVQNLSDNLQLAVRYEKYDPNTDVTGADIFSVSGTKGSTLRGVASNSGFGGDLAVNTISVDVNVFISGSMRLMFDYDHVTQEEFTKNGGTSAAPVIATVADPHDDRFTFRMQYKF